MKTTHENNTKASKNYKQISMTERQLIERWHRQKLTLRQIAEFLGRHRSSIYRELQIGRVIHKDSELRELPTYSSDRGQDVRLERASAHGAPLKIACDHRLVRHFRKPILNNKMSLYAAHSLLKAKNVDTKICVRTLYNYVHRFMWINLYPRKIFKGVSSLQITNQYSFHFSKTMV